MEAFRRDEEFVQGIATRWEPVADVPSDGGTLLENENLSRALLARVEAGEEAPSFTKEQFVAFETGKVHRGHYIQAGEKVFRPIMGPGLIPIQIKVMDLQRKLAMDVHEQLFADTWNFVDAYLQLLYGSGSLRYQFLRQALLARRALIILDGIDEGGANKDRIQRHVTEVMAAQGHPLLVTSRPAGLSDALYSDFNKLQMKPLTDDQQEMIVRSRLRAIDDEAHVGDFLTYIRESMPIDETTGERITGNPLMLTMVCCIYESHRSVDKMPEHVVKMPEHVVDLYRTASDIMLSHVEKKHRAKGGQPQQLKPLLMRIALATHSSIKRQILAKDVDGLLDLEADEKLQQELRTTWTSVQQQLTEGRIPLLSMLQREPLEFQFSHLSFQEYFTVCAICEGLPLKPEVMPWRWLAWWKNVLRFGGELKRFGPGLSIACGLHLIKTLDISGKLVPDISIATEALFHLIKSCTLEELDIRDTNMTEYAAAHLVEVVIDHPTLKTISELPLDGLKAGTLYTLDCRQRNYGPLQMHLLMQLAERMKLEDLSLWSNSLTHWEHKIAGLLKKNSSLTCINLRETEITGEHVFPVVESHTTLQKLDVSWNPRVGTDGASPLSEMLKNNSALTQLSLVGCSLSASMAQPIARMLEQTKCMRSIDLSHNHLGSEASCLGPALSKNIGLSFLGLSDNSVPDAAGASVVQGLKEHATLQAIDLSTNLIGVSSLSALIEVLSSGTSCLRELRVRHNALSACIESITLLMNTPLQLLELSGCKLGSADTALLCAMASSVGASTTLTHLDLSDCALDDRVSDTLATALSVNTSLKYLWYATALHNPTLHWLMHGHK